jgi:hypothetical protein
MSYKIPQNNKYYVSNASDLIPNIQYVRNIDMDEEGYLKLSPPFLRLHSGDETSDFGLLDDAIKGSSSGYKFITDDKIYDMDLGDGTATLDASAPSGADEMRFNTWKGGLWYVNAVGDIYSLTANGTTWDVENTDSINYAEVFVNKNTLVGVSGSKIQQYLTTDMDYTTPTGTNSGQTLTLPEHMDIRGLSYSNYRIGIATRDVGGKMAYFFVWDGATAEASQGFPVYAPMILDLIAYKNSWVILTSVGQVLLFNGGGFDLLGNLPCYYKGNENWIVYGGSQAFGRGMYTDGDVIYFNVGSLMESTEDDSGILKGMYGGVWCYDPAVGGIYHRYGLAHSKYVTDQSDLTGGVYTYSAHGLETGDKIRYDGGVTKPNQILFAIKVTADTYKIAETYDLAIAGTASATAYNNGKRFVKRTDWSQLTVHSTNTGACIKMNDGTSFVNDGVHPFFSSMILATEAMASNDTTCIMSPLFDNIGTITYAKIKSENLEDTWNSVTVKHRKLTDGDKIIVKYKLTDAYKQIAVGEADDISADIFVTWTSATTFTTTKDLTEVNVGDEVEIWSGAGAGMSAHIVTATNNAGTWTVVLDESMRCASGNKSTVLFDSFQKLAVITKDTTGSALNQAKLALGLPSKWIQIKLELRGNSVVVEELIIDNATQLPIR